MGIQIKTLDELKEVLKRAEDRGKVSVRFDYALYKRFVESYGLLADENERLKKWFEHIVRGHCWNEDGLDGGDCQDKGVSLGLLVPMPPSQDDLLDGHDLDDVLYYFVWSKYAESAVEEAKK